MLSKKKKMYRFLCVSEVLITLVTRETRFRKTGAGWISYWRLGLFYTKISIMAVEFSRFPANLSCLSFSLFCYWK